MPIRVALGEDSLIVREGVQQLLAVDPEVEIVAAVGGPALAPPGLRGASSPTSCSPTSACRPPTPTRASASPRELRDSHPEIGVVILSQFSDPTYALALLDHGSDGRAYLLKERVHNRAELMAAIRAVADGRVDDRPEGRRGAGRRPQPRRALAAQRADGARAARCSREIAQGKSNTAIAESLFLTKRAVEKHINAIFWKLGLADAADVSKRVKAALMFLAEEAASPVS